jgi:PsbP-like protein
MKKYFLFVIAIVAIVVMASGCTSQTGNNTTATKTYSANGMTFNYPSNWEIINDTTNENGTVVALGDADIQQNNTVKGNGATIIKVPQNANSTADLNDLKTQFANLNGTNSTVSIDGITANETTISTKINNVTAQLQFIDFSKNNFIYLIQYATIASDIKTQEQLFNIITQSFKTS